MIDLARLLQSPCVNSVSEPAECLEPGVLIEYSKQACQIFSWRYAVDQTSRCLHHHRLFRIPVVCAVPRRCWQRPHPRRVGDYGTDAPGHSYCRNLGIAGIHLSPHNHQRHLRRSGSVHHNLLLHRVAAPLTAARVMC